MVTSPDAAGFTRAPRAIRGRAAGDRDGEDLARRFGGTFDARAVRQAERIGILVPAEDGRWTVPSPTLLRAGEQLIAEGIPLRHALAVAERIDRHTRAIAEAFVRLFVQDVVAPRKADWEAIAAALERLRPLAGDAVLAAFHQRMTRAVEESLGRSG